MHQLNQMPQFKEPASQGVIPSESLPEPLAGLALAGPSGAWLKRECMPAGVRCTRAHGLENNCLLLLRFSISHAFSARQQYSCMSMGIFTELKTELKHQCLSRSGAM